MEQEVWKHIIYGNVSKDFYKNNRKLLDQTNYNSVKIAYEFSTFLFFILTLVGKFYSVVSETWIPYLGLAFACALMTVVVLVWLPNHIRFVRAFYYVFEVIGLGAAILAGTYFSPNDLAVLFFVLLIILPLLYIERPITSIRISFTAYIIFCIATYSVKHGNSYLVQIDILNATMCMLIGVVFIYYVRSMHLRNLQATMILHARAEVDGLTGVLNKTSTEKACEGYLTLHGLEQNCALLIVDIDNFKLINDTLGHKQGDALLRQIGQILRYIFREKDIVGRVGGDEFMVLMKDVHDIRIAEVKAQKIIEDVTAIFSEYSIERYGCSVGISNNKKQGITFQDMYRMADHALYHAKEKGKGRHEVYSEYDEVMKKEVPTILVVDDVEVSRAILRACFEDDYNVLEAEDGQKALTLIEKYYQHISIILLDLEMPKVNGYEVLKYIKKSPELKNIPVMIITAHNKKELFALELGADDLIKKPYDPLVVKRRVENTILRKKENQRNT